MIYGSRTKIYLVSDFILQRRRKILSPGVSDLVIRCRRGDEDAWRTLVKDHQDRVINLLYQLTNDYHLAVDLAQETFLQVFRCLDKFRGDSHLSTWITKIAINRWRSAARKSVLNKKIQLQLQTEILVTVDSAHRIEINERLRQALSQLPAEMRVAFILRELQGLSYQQISKVSGVAIGTVESRLYRARRRLRQSLADLV